MTVLVVEDSRSLADVLVEGLRDQGMSVDAARDGLAAAAKLHARAGLPVRQGPLEQAWDEQADPFTNTVTVTIGRPRRKLGDPPVITTTPGVGYRIADAH